MLKEELDKKVEEIKSKDLIIKRLEDDNESSSESSDEDVTVKKKPGLIVGQGYFGKHFEPREGMEEEAEALRKEWRSKQ